MELRFVHTRKPYRSKVRATLTQPQAAMLLRVLGAGEIELSQDGVSTARDAATYERARAVLAGALRAAEDRDAAKAAQAKP